MELGHLVRFSSQQYPFLVETSPCLDLDCSCSIMRLTLKEVDRSGTRSGDALSFTLRVCLKTWVEHDPPPRSLEVETLAREFMARFPTERIQELGDEFEQTRAVQRRLQSLRLSGSPDELVTYSQVTSECGGIREGFTKQNFFFVFEGREFLIEDHYCANPQCDCQQVHVEFWERVQQFHPKRGIKIQQRLMATFSLEGEQQEIRFNEETASTAKHLLRAWRQRHGEQLQAFRRRYDQIKVIGTRSFPASPTSTLKVDRGQASVANKRPPKDQSPRPPQRVGRNTPCPCGSGLKFKRCCGRQLSVSD